MPRHKDKKKEGCVSSVRKQGSSLRGFGLRASGFCDHKGRTLGLLTEETKAEKSKRQKGRDKKRRGEHTAAHRKDEQREGQQMVETK